MQNETEIIQRREGKSKCQESKVLFCHQKNKSEEYFILRIISPVKVNMREFLTAKKLDRKKVWFTLISQNRRTNSGKIFLIGWYRLPTFSTLLFLGLFMIFFSNCFIHTKQKIDVCFLFVIRNSLLPDSSFLLINLLEMPKNKILKSVHFLK